MRISGYKKKRFRGTQKKRISDYKGKDQGLTRHDESEISKEKNLGNTKNETIGAYNLDNR